MRKEIISTIQFKQSIRYFSNKLSTYKQDGKIKFSKIEEKKDFIRFSVLFEFPSKLHEDDREYFVHIVANLIYHYFDYAYDTEVIDYDNDSVEIEVILYPYENFKNFESVQKCKTVEELEEILNQVQFVLNSKVIPGIKLLFKKCSEFGIHSYSDIANILPNLSNKTISIIEKRMDKFDKFLRFVMEELSESVKYERCEQFIPSKKNIKYVKRFPTGRGSRQQQNLFSYYRNYLTHFIHLLMNIDYKNRKYDITSYLEFLYHFKDQHLILIKNAVDKTLEEIRSNPDSFKG